MVASGFLQDFVWVQSVLLPQNRLVREVQLSSVGFDQVIEAQQHGWDKSIKSFAVLCHIVFSEAMFYNSPSAGSQYTPCSAHLIYKVAFTNTHKLFSDRLPSLIRTFVALLGFNGIHCCTAALGYL
jgi:hypothetical protein